MIRIFLFLLLLGSELASAQELFLSRNARTFEAHQSSLMVKSMAHSCLTVSVVPDGLPCNPANLPLSEDNEFYGEILLSNGYNMLGNIQSLLSGDVNDELIGTLFSDEKVLQAESNVELVFSSSNFAAKYTPYSIKALTVVRNESNPDVELFAFEEQSLVLQGAKALSEDFYVGGQVRFVDRSFIKQRFKLLELGTSEGKKILEPQEQFASYIEPAVTWFIGESWRPRISAKVANLGVVDKEYEEFHIPPELELGFGVSPDVLWGDLDIMLELISMTYEESFLERFRLGSLYRFGAMNLAGGIDTNGISGGVFYELKSVNAGIMYSSTTLTKSDYFTQTVYVQLGWKI